MSSSLKTNSQLKIKYFSPFPFPLSPNSRANPASRGKMVKRGISPKVLNYREQRNPMVEAETDGE